MHYEYYNGLWVVLDYADNLVTFFEKEESAKQYIKDWVSNLFN
jgi:hypothetical protein